ncbi:ATP-dependent DNA helicase RecG [bacterium]|nr:ATP-dependent DNA helicase RecG [bacterium]
MKENLLYFFKPLNHFYGVGEKFYKSLERLLSRPRVLELLFHFPTGFTDRTYTAPLSHIQTGKIATLKVSVLKHIQPPFKRGKKIPYKIICTDNTGNITLNFFQIYDYIKNNLQVGKSVCISGKVESFNGELIMIHPDYIVPVENFDDVAIMEPIYPLTYAVNNKMIVSLVRQVLKTMPNLPEWQPEADISFSDAIRILHTDFSNEKLRAKAKSRLAYDEVLANQLSLALSRNKVKEQCETQIKTKGMFRTALLKSLGYDLTNAQKRVVGEILTDLSSPLRMLRLLQGDVGSGKTIVAIIALLEIAEFGGQGAFMVPTEILANQHFETITKLLSNSGLTDKVKPILLTGSDKGKVKKAKLEAIKNGDANLIIGTHALFQNDVEFKNMQLAVIDEQHKFGVHQRFELSEKGGENRANILAMTATPIPRTLAMTSFGDMDLSIIDEMPPGRKIVETNLCSQSKLQQVISLIQTRLENNQIKKLYWVCPLVEESEKLDLTAVIERFEDLKKTFGEMVGLIHGKMKPDEKDNVMLDFANPNGKVKILLATSVIEVGVNVPEATLMIIEHSERFGLSSLHQLRGRIGRGGDKSTCLLLHTDKLTKVAKSRLSILKQTTNGFKIAEEDLKLRGSGDVLGIRQSGQIDFKIADLSEDTDLFFAAMQDTKNILATDKGLLNERGTNLRLLLTLFEYKEQLKNILAG